MAKGHFVPAVSLLEHQLGYFTAPFKSTFVTGIVEQTRRSRSRNQKLILLLAKVTRGFDSLVWGLTMHFVSDSPVNTSYSGIRSKVLDALVLLTSLQSQGANRCSVIWLITRKLLAVFI